MQSPLSGVVTKNGSDTEQVSRRVVSMEEADHLDKTLNVLAGRTEELRERLSRVLVPENQAGPPNDQKEVGRPQGSMVTERFRSMRGIAESTIRTIDDILSRLDV